MCLGTATPTVSPCWKVKIIWSPTSETSPAVIYSLYFILYFIRPIIYLGLAHGAWICPLYSVFQITPGSAACLPPTAQLKPSVGLVAHGLVPMILRCCLRFNPRHCEKWGSLASPPCSCNFDQALMWLGSDPDMTGPATCKRSVERRGEGAGRAYDMTSKPGEERNYSEGVFSLLLLCLVGNKGFMYSFYPGKNCDL